MILLRPRSNYIPVLLLFFLHILPFPIAGLFFRWWYLSFEISAVLFGVWLTKNYRSQTHADTHAQKNDNKINTGTHLYNQINSCRFGFECLLACLLTRSHHHSWIFRFFRKLFKIKFWSSNYICKFYVFLSALAIYVCVRARMYMDLAVCLKILWWKCM